MKLFKRPTRLERLLALCRHVRTGQGRNAHLEHPEHGILCRWPGVEWTEADPDLPVCRMCADEAVRLSAGEVA